jgi:hypothetical protein
MPTKTSEEGEGMGITQVLGEFGRRGRRSFGAGKCKSSINQASGPWDQAVMDVRQG